MNAYPQPESLLGRHVLLRVETQAKSGNLLHVGDRGVVVGELSGIVGTLTIRLDCEFVELARPEIEIAA